jgi:hypothetical protein
MYHWEADQEDFLVLDGEALVIVEGEERALGRWDFVHCPAGTNHILVGGRVSAGAWCSRSGRARGRRPGSGADTGSTRWRSGTASAVERETSTVGEAYARFGQPRPARYRDGSLPGG